MVTNENFSVKIFIIIVEELIDGFINLANARLLILIKISEKVKILAFS